MSKVATYRLAHYTNAAHGKRVHDVQYGGMPLIPEQADEEWTRAYALAAFKNARGPRVLVEWDGDTGVETVLDRYPAQSKGKKMSTETRNEAHAEEAMSVGTERRRNDLAARVAIASRKAGSPINAYHARADIDKHIRQGHSFEDLPTFYTRYYGIPVTAS